MAKLLNAMLCSLRGSVCLYQGEELGLAESDVPYEALRDPYGIAFWPNFKGRDGCRTPMPWTGGANGGFSAAAPWLPVPESHLRSSVAEQERDPASVLNAFKDFLRWRKTQPALLHGSIRMLDTPEPVLAFVREHAGDEWLAAFNLSGETAHAKLSFAVAITLDGHALPAGELVDGNLSLPAFGVFFARLQRAAVSSPLVGEDARRAGEGARA